MHLNRVENSLKRGPEKYIKFCHLILISLSLNVIAGVKWERKINSKSFLFPHFEMEELVHSLYDCGDVHNMLIVSKVGVNLRSILKKIL